MKSKNLIESGNPRLLKFPVKGGKEFSLTLEYLFGVNRETGTEKRKREALSLYILANPRDPMQRQQNKDTIELARRIRWEREQEFLQNREGYRLKKERRIYFMDFYQQYIDNYTKKDIRMIKIAKSRFIDFLTENQKHPAAALMPDAITREMVMKFADYLQTRSVGLSPEEIQQLIATHYPMEKANIRNAFIFCLYTGMRFCDVKDLTFASVDYANKLLRFEQDKTKGHSARSWVSIPLNDGLLSLIGQPPKNGGKDALVFNLSSYESSCKAVKRWVKHAGIDKHISWHCARHSFAVNILNNGANIKTVASLLGHSGLKHTEKYTRVVDKLKEEAINSLPELKIDRNNKGLVR